MQSNDSDACLFCGYDDSVIWVVSPDDQKSVFYPMWESLFTALALLFVLEGVIPFLYPGKWRNLVATLAQISDRQLRIMGLVSMLLGIGLLYLVK